MATLTVGRVRALSADTLWGAKAWNVSGDKVSLEGVIYAPGITDAKTLRAQLIGHQANLDEEVVPVTWSADASVDGYYRVISAAVNMRGPALAHGWFEVSMELERVLGYASPVFESVLVGATLTNALGINGAPFLALPATVDGQSNTSFSTNEGRTSADGSVRIIFYSVYPVVSRYLLAPASYYVGAATVEVEDAANALQVVTGRQCENKPNDWRLSNGLVRVTPLGAVGRIDVSHYDGTTWETAKTYNIGEAGGTLTYEHIAILRNSPEECVIRLTASSTRGIGEGRILVDLSLRRGDAFVRVYITSQTGRAWSVGRDTAEAATSQTGGLHATATDASGNKYVLTSATATTKDLVQGSLTLPASATAVGFGIGSSINSAAPINPNVITGVRGMIEQYFAAQSEVMAVAGQ